VTRKNATLPPEYFEVKYQADIDPWRFRSSDYERGKYRATIEALAKAKYATALEVGCSIGVFTRLLSERCTSLLAIDASPTAIEVAKLANPEVSFLAATLPQEFPKGRFDLIVLSEVLYYFTELDLKRVAQSCVDAITQNGEIILCHWLGETDYPLTGVEASEHFAQYIKSAMPVRSIVHDAIYRLERFSAA
jgi:2-polyprenyl-3-methyl-5-hydroxy-6-metoxy-1,4-benzoquinol methylase